MDWENLFLYNRFLLDEDGENAIAGQPGFNSLEEAEDWLVEQDIRASVQIGKRIGARLVAA